MNLKQPANSNYAAVVVKLHKIEPITNRDRIVATPVFNYQAIVGIDTKVGDIGVVFPPEVQLSEAYCRENNLFRHEDFNADKTKTGYLEDNRRVKAIKFAGARSDCLFMPLSSLSFTGVDISQLKEGDTFDELNGQTICQKYTVHKNVGSGKPKDARVKFERVDRKMFPEFDDIDNFFRVKDSLDPNSNVIVTQKLHGTQGRMAHILVARKLSWAERVAKMFGIRVQTTEYAHIDGSHHVVKDRTNPQGGYYDDKDLWNRHGKELDECIPKDTILYGEIVGFTVTGGSIQKHYTYEQETNTSRFYCFRVVTINPDGIEHEMDWDSVVEFCDRNDIDHVRELWRGKLKDFDADSFMDKKYSDTFPQAVKLSKDSPCDEGVVIRVGHLRPRFVKAKSPLFLNMESKQLDTDDEGIQEQ